MVGSEDLEKGASLEEYGMSDREPEQLAGNVVLIQSNLQDSLQKACT